MVFSGLIVGTVIAAPYDTNLLTNPGAETNNMTGWTTGGSWSTNFDGLIHSGSHSFATSYTWSTRGQTIDLIADGFTTVQLDANLKSLSANGLPRDPGGGLLPVFFSAEFQLAGHRLLEQWQPEFTANHKQWLGRTLVLSFQYFH